MATYRSLHDLIHRAATGLNHGLEVPQSLPRLFLDAARHNLHSHGIEWDTSRDEDKIASLDCLGVRSYRRWCIYMTKSVSTSAAIPPYELSVVTTENDMFLRLFLDGCTFGGVFV